MSFYNLHESQVHFSFESHTFHVFHYLQFRKCFYKYYLLPFEVDAFILPL